MSKKIIFCQYSAMGNKDAVEYFRRKSKKFAHLLLSFHHLRSQRKTSLSVYERGKKIKEWELISWHPRRQLVFLLMPFLYLVHLLNILRLTYLLKERFDAEACNKLITLLQSPSLASYKASTVSSDICRFSFSTINLTLFSMSFFSNNLNLKIAHLDWIGSIIFEE